MSNIEVARDFFQANLPANLLARIDLQQLELSADSHISKDLDAKYTDLMFYVS